MRSRRVRRSELSSFDHDLHHSPAMIDYTQAGATWTWDGVKWVAQGTGTGIYLPLAGGTMTGDITLKGDPSAPLHPVTYRMVSNPNDNRICNGDMRIDQRNNGASGTASGYTVDRWAYAGSTAGQVTWGRSINVISPEFPYSLIAASTSAHVLAASDVFFFRQPIEADMISDFQWGTANAKSVTLSFWVFSSLTGTFNGFLQNSATNRSYPFTFISTDYGLGKRSVVTIPGDTAGTWNMSGNGQGVGVHFDLGSGATFRGPAGAWASANYVGATGSVSVVSTNGGAFFVTGVKLEIGSVATPFNHYSLAKSMADCQRYYQVGAIAGMGGYNSAGGQDYFPITFPVTECARFRRLSSTPLASVAVVHRYCSCRNWQYYRCYVYRCDYNPSVIRLFIGLQLDGERGALTMTYTLTANENTIVRDEDGAFIPTDPDNIDYAEYLAWLDEGNEPNAYVPPPAAKAERTK